VLHEQIHIEALLGELVLSGAVAKCEERQDRNDEGIESAVSFERPPMSMACE
jgi:hypothetical protein